MSVDLARESLQLIIMTRSQKLIAVDTIFLAEPDDLCQIMEKRTTISYDKVNILITF